MMDDKFGTMVRYTSEHMLTSYLRQGFLSLKESSYVPITRLGIIGDLIGQLTSICRSIEVDRPFDEDLESEVIRLRTQLIHFGSIELTLRAMLDMDECRFALSLMLDQLQTESKSRLSLKKLKKKETQPMITPCTTQADSVKNSSQSTMIGSAYKRYKDKMLNSWTKKPLRQSMADVMNVVYNRTHKAVSNAGFSTIDEEDEEEHLFDSVSFRTHRVDK
ncbi:hypothetical protein ACOME3_005483 [Neoechinorhynchus agilis]